MRLSARLPHERRAGAPAFPVDAWTLIREVFPDRGEDTPLSQVTLTCSAVTIALPRKALHGIQLVLRFNSRPKTFRREIIHSGAFVHIHEPRQEGDECRVGAQDARAKRLPPEASRLQQLDLLVRPAPFWPNGEKQTVVHWLNRW